MVGRWLRCQSWALLQDGQPEANAIPEQLVFCEDYLFTDMFSSVQLLSHVQLFVIPWNSLGQNTGVGSLSLLQGIFPT